MLIVLVVANVAMLGWRWLESAEDETPGAAASAPASAAEVPGPAEDEPIAEVLLLSERPSEPEPTAVVAPSGKPPVQPAAEPAAEPAAGAEPPLELEIAEADGSEPAAMAEAEPEAPVGADPTSAAIDPGSEEPVCRVWGPFNDDAEAKALAADLGLSEGGYQILDEKMAGAPDYLVYIDHGGNREAARRLLQELRAREVDGYIMRGRFNDAISVGVFSQRARALRQQERVAAMGYTPRVEVLERTQRIAYLAARVPRSTIERGGANKPCRDIASIQDIL